MSTLEQALGGMADIPQWFVWRLEWDQAEGKYQKRPAHMDGRALSKGESTHQLLTDYDSAVSALQTLPKTPQLAFSLGFWLTEACGYWFFDIDMRKCGLLDYQASEYVMSLVNAFPGALVEWSSGRKGLHVIGSGPAPEHRNKPPREVKQLLGSLDLEFYTRDRGIAFGLTGQAQGCADTVLSVEELCAQFFPPRAKSDTALRPEWRGPEDDDVLVQRMLAARQSAAATFDGKSSLAQLWRGEVERNSESDMALASHLAFWTGCDEERMKRMMLRSGLKREKWFERRLDGTYLTYTIANACESCENVYQEPQRNLAVQNQLYEAAPVTQATGPRIAPEQFAVVERLLSLVSACGNEQELHNEVFPAITAAGVPGALQERLVGAVKAKLAFWDNKIAVGKVRATLFPPPLREPAGEELPDWAKKYCWVTSQDAFYNTENGDFLSLRSFDVAFGRMMPVGDSGRRVSAAERCTQFWNMPIVEQVGYRPDCGPFYEWDGVRFANSYSPSSLPECAAAYSAEGLAGIEAFQSMLYDMCGRRDGVFRNLLYWYAHNVQRPGKKIRWAPIIKGIHGDGKTLAVTVLRAAMGHRNLSTTSNSNIANSGGFTDWAVPGAVNVIEEIMLTGRQRHQLYNAMKEFISNNVVDVNVKGGKPRQQWNCTNHYANTNHNDALPLESTDRRWFVIFTPWASTDEMLLYCGLDAASWKRRTDAIDAAKERCAGELRAWLLGITIPAEFDIGGSAMMTPEKRRMLASSKDDAESVIESLIADGAVGICRDVVSTSHLSRLVAQRSQGGAFDVPKTTALSFILTRLGYSKVDDRIKWRGETLRIWLRNGVELTNDEVRDKLDNTSPNMSPV